MDVGIVIPTWNRADLLRGALESLTRLELPAGLRVETLVVNNGSTDATDAVARSFAARLPALQLLHESVPGVAAARNRALGACRARHVVFIDDDVRVEPGWLASFACAVRDFPKAAAFGGPVTPCFPTPPDPALLDAFPEVRIGFCGIDHGRPLGPLPAPLRVVGANMAFRRDVLDAVGFDTSLGVSRTSLVGGEEDALIAGLRRQGLDVIWVPGMRIEHVVEPERLELEYLLRFVRDRARTQIRLDGIPPGPRIAGAPLVLWRRYLRALLRAGLAAPGRHPLVRARRRAKVERYRARISECRRVARTARAPVQTSR